jgi:Na+-driven multidrug efflux pump
MEQNRRETFFTKEKGFYTTLFRMMLVLALQNLVAYSINMADNVMLGNYDQNALSGAATVNQVFFMVQQFALSIGNALVVLASQYWGEKRTEPMRRLTGIALWSGLLCGLVILIICVMMPEQLLRLFTDTPEILNEGMRYKTLNREYNGIYFIKSLTPENRGWQRCCKVCRTTDTHTDHKN